MNDLRFSLWSRRFHWLVFILVVAALALIYAHGWSPKESTLRAVFKWAHIQFGIVILLVMLPRIIVRWRTRRPPIIPPPARWQKRLANLVQFVLYVLLIAIPLLGMETRVWSPDAWNFLGISMPNVRVPDKAFSERLEEIHGTLGNILMFLAGAHAAIALAHHFIQRDSTLRGMLPFWRRVNAISASSSTVGGQEK